METKLVISEILKDIEDELEDQEIVNLLMETIVSKNQSKKDNTFGQRAADKLAKGAGSWTFVIGFALFLVVWIVINTIMALNAFDPYPFILLNLVLSCLAAIQAPLIMMSQNRQEEKDRERALNDYRVNLKTEIMMKSLYESTNQIKEVVYEIDSKLNNPIE